jgi:hypothetical protein
MTRDDAEAWLARYGHAWMEGDPALARRQVPGDRLFVLYERIAVIDCPAIRRRRRVLLSRRHRRHASPEAAALRGSRIP